jgi:hypothetical protein
MAAQYVIASQEGMAPFATAVTKEEALKLSRRARMLGFSGRIVKCDPPLTANDKAPPVVLQIGDHKIPDVTNSRLCLQSCFGTERQLDLMHQMSPEELSEFRPFATHDAKVKFQQQGF